MATGDKETDYHVAPEKVAEVRREIRQRLSKLKRVTVSGATKTTPAERNKR